MPSGLARLDNDLTTVTQSCNKDADAGVLHVGYHMYCNWKVLQ
jgi:hypothetical protein